MPRPHICQTCDRRLKKIYIRGPGPQFPFLPAGEICITCEVLYPDEDTDALSFASTAKEVPDGQIQLPAV